MTPIQKDKEMRRMPIKAEREYRAALPFEAVAPNEEGSTEYIVEGYATTFDKPYDFGRGGMKEMIRSSAFDSADMDDVIFQYDHEGLVMARQRNETLKLDRDGHGLRIRADLSGSQKGRELYEAIKNGLVDRMSWAFTVPEDGWEYDADTRTSIISKVDKVFDVSAVSIPANAETEIQARSYLDGVIERQQQQELLQRKEERSRLAAQLTII